MFKITEIQLFSASDDRSIYSANIAINDEFMLQRGTDGEYSIPHSCLACWNGDEKQDAAHELLNAAELARFVDADAAIAKSIKSGADWV